LFRGFGPDEWLRVFVPALDPFANVGFKCLNAAVVASLEQISGDVGKESFDLVDPGGVGRGEVHVESGVRFKPFNDAGGLVGAVVIADQMNF